MSTVQSFKSLGSTIDRIEEEEEEGKHVENRVAKPSSKWRDLTRV